MNRLKEDFKEFMKNNKLILKTQQRFIGEKHTFTELINKIALISNDNKILKSINRNIWTWNEKRFAKWKRRY